MSERFQVGDRVRLVAGVDGPIGSAGVVVRRSDDCSVSVVDFGTPYGMRHCFGGSLELLSRNVTQPVAPLSSRLDAAARAIKHRMTSRLDPRSAAAAALAAADAVDPVRTDLAAALRNLTRLQLEHAEREGRL